MENFSIFNPTKLFFGKDVVLKLGKNVSKKSKNVLIVYGKGSIENNGILDTVKTQLNSEGINFVIYKGIKSNPIIEDVDGAISVGVENMVDGIVAIGGGSVIDSAKIIALGIAEKAKGWDIMKFIVTPKSVIPLYAVLTLAATGTEMNSFAVVQNHKTGEKIGYASPLINPLESYLDPSYTYSVPADYTSYGIADIIAHCLEAFFGQGECDLTDMFTASIIKNVMEVAPKLLNDLTNYDYRAQIMYAATMGLNGTTSFGKISADWGVHALGHDLSLLYDTPHGASLAIAYPAWLKVKKEEVADKIARLGELVFETNDINITIQKFEEFFVSIKCPVRLSEINVTESNRQEYISSLIKNKASGYNILINEEEYNLLFETMLK